MKEKKTFFPAKKYNLGSKLITFLFTNAENENIFETKRYLTE